MPETRSPAYRVFDGKRFHRTAGTMGKRNAFTVAAEYRRRGKRTRIVKAKQGEFHGWYVYTRSA